MKKMVTEYYNFLENENPKNKNKKRSKIVR